MLKGLRFLRLVGVVKFQFSRAARSLPGASGKLIAATRKPSQETPDPIGRRGSWSRRPESRRPANNEQNNQIDGRSFECFVPWFLRSTQLTVFKRKASASAPPDMPRRSQTPGRHSAKESSSCSPAHGEPEKLPVRTIVKHRGPSARVRLWPSRFSSAGLLVPTSSFPSLLSYFCTVTEHPNLFLAPRRAFQLRFRSKGTQAGSARGQEIVRHQAQRKKPSKSPRRDHFNRVEHASASRQNAKREHDQMAAGNSPIDSFGEGLPLPSCPKVDQHERTRSWPPHRTASATNGRRRNSSSAPSA